MRRRMWGLLAYLVAAPAWASSSAPDTTPPADITGITAIVGTNPGEVSITWTSVGDDGMTGTVQAYVVRYATFSLDFVGGSTATWWNGGASSPTFSYAQSWAPAAPGTTESRVMNGLTEGVTFYFGVIARDSHGNQSSLNTLAAGVPARAVYPATVTTLSALAGSLGLEVRLTWVAPGDDGAVGTATTYALHRATAIFTIPWPSSVTVTITQTSTSAAVLTPKAGGSAEQHTATGLAAGTTFYFVLKAEDEAGNYSYSNQAWSPPRVDDTPPSAVTSLAAATGGADGTVDVTWVYAPDQDDTLPAGYRIHYATFSFPALLSDAEMAVRTVTFTESTPTFSLLTGLGTAYSTQTVTVTGLARRATYWFAARARDSAGNRGLAASVASAAAKDAVAPDAVTGISALVVGPDGGRVQVSWVSPPSDAGVSTSPAVASYDIKYATYGAVTPANWWAGLEGAAPWLLTRASPVPQSPGAVETQVISGLAGPATSYYFAVRAQDAAGNAAAVSTTSASGPVGGDTLSPAAIADLSGLRDAVDRTKISLTWTAPADPNSVVSAYAVKYSTGGTLTDTTAWWSGGSGTTTVSVIAQAWTPIAAGGAESRQLTAMPTAALYILIRSSDAANNVSSFSSFAIIPAAGDATPPGQVADLAVSSVSIAAVTTLYGIGLAAPVTAQVELTWTAPADDGTAGVSVAAMLVRYSTASIATVADWNGATVPTGVSGPLNAPSVLAPGVKQSYVVTGLTTGTTYYFAVRGQDAAGNLGALSTGTTTSCLPSQVVPIGYLLTLTTNGISSYAGEYYHIGPVTIVGSTSTASGMVMDPVTGRGIQVNKNGTAWMTGGAIAATVSKQVVAISGRVGHGNGTQSLEDIRQYEGGMTTVNLPAPAWTPTASQLQTGSQNLSDTTNPETYESHLVALRGVQKVDVASNTWPVGTGAVNYQVFDDTGGVNAQATIRFSQGTQMSGLVAEPGVGVRFDVIGALAQFDTTDPWFSGYQVFPTSNTATTKNLAIIERPRALSALPGNLSVTLTWAAVNDPDRNGFRIYSSTAFPSVGAWTMVVDTGAPATTQITVTSGLTPGTTYYFSVAMKQATNTSWAAASSAGGVYQESGHPLANGLAIGEVAWVGFGDAPDTVAPSSPTAVSALPAASVEGGIALSWTAPGDDGNSGTATKYLIRYATWPTGGLPDTTGWWDGALAPPTGAKTVETYRNVPAPRAAGTADAVTLSGLVVGATYYVAMRALDEAGNVSTLSNWVWAPASNLEPSAPTNLTASAFGGGVSLTWAIPVVPGQFGEWLTLTDVSSGGYRVYYNEARTGWRLITGGANGTGAYDNLVSSVTLAQGVSVNGSSRTYGVSGLKNGTTYYFVVAAVDASGNLSTPSAEISAVPVASLPIRITEVSFFGPNDNNLLDGSAGKDSFVELYNASDSPVDISKWFVTSRSLSSALNNNFVRGWVPPGTVLGGRQHYVIGFVENTGLYRAGTRMGIVYPLADTDWGNPETLDAVNEKATGVWPAGQGPGASSFGISKGSNLILLPPSVEASVDKSVSGSWKILNAAMAGQPVVDRITMRSQVTGGTGYSSSSDGVWPDGNGKYIDTQADSPPGTGPTLTTRVSSQTLTYQRKDENVDNDRLDDWTVRIANPGVGGDLNPPAAPSGLSVLAAPVDSVVQVSWTPNTESDLKEYRLYRATWTSGLGNKAVVGTVAPPGTTHQDAGFTNETPVFYQMTARDASLNESGGSAEAGVFVRDTLAPPVPTGVAVAGTAGGGALRLYWNASAAADVKDYGVYRASYVGAGLQAGPIARISAPGTTHQDGGLTNGATYFYRLTARDVNLNESGGSVEVSGVPTTDSTPPAVPAGLGAGPVAAGGAAALSWVANTEPDLKDYGVYRATFVGAGLQAGPIARIASPGTTHQSFGLTNGTTYYFRLTTRDTSLNESGGSSDISAYVKDGTPPAAPTGLQLGNLGAGAVKVWWLAGAETDLRDYGLYRATYVGAGLQAGPVVRVVAPGTTHQDGGLVSGATYYYRLTARDTGLNESPGSAEAFLIVSADTIPPSGIANLAASARAGGVWLTWTAPGNDGTVGTAPSYEARYSTAPIGSEGAYSGAAMYAQTWAPLASGGAEARGLGGLTPGTTYYVSVRARDGGANLGPLSNTATGYVNPLPTLASIATARGFVNGNGEPVEADLVTNHRDKVYTIRGIVTVKKGMMNVNSATSDATIFVQDETAGIPVYDENNQAFPAEVKEGDFVEIKGRVGFFKGITEIHPQTNPSTNQYAEPTDVPSGAANFQILGSSANPPALTTGGGATLSALLPILEFPYTVVAASEVGRDLLGLWPHQRTNPENPNNRAEELDGRLVRLTGVQQTGIVTSIVEDDVGTLPSTSAAPGGTFVDSWLSPYSRHVVQNGTGLALIFVSERTDLSGPVYSSTGGVIGYVPAPLPPSTSSVDVVGVLWQRYSPVSVATKYLAYYNIGLRYIGRVSGQVTVGGSPQSGALVEVLQSSAVVAWSTTGSDGRYEVALGTTTTAAPSSSTVRVTVSGRTPVTTESRVIALGERWVKNLALAAAASVTSSTTGLVDPGQGATVTNPDVPGTQLVVPAGAFTVPVQVTIATKPVAVAAETLQAADAAETAPGGALLVDAALADTVREIRALDAGGTALQPVKDVTLVIPFNSLRVRAAYVPLLRIFRLNEVTRRWELAAAADRQVVDAAGGWVSAPVAHFSVFRLAVYRAPATVLDQVRVFPNPVTFATAVRSTVKLDQLTAQPTVRIYTLTGELVREIPAGTPLQTDGTVNAGNSGVAEWGGTNGDGAAVARGTYVLLITDDKGGRVVRKLAVLK